MIASGNRPLIRCSSLGFDHGGTTSPKLGFLKFSASNCTGKDVRSSFVAPVKAMEGPKMSYVNVKADSVRELHHSGSNTNENVLRNDSDGESINQMSISGNPTNIVWHKCSVEKIDRQQLLHQKGCVIWITGLSGSGKSTLACALSRGLHSRGKLTYVLDGDNVRHGLNCDLSFKAEDRAENIRRIGEVAKLFADAGVICIASLISPYRKERDACRALLPEGEFIEVFMDMPLQVCEARDPKGLYKLARAGNIKGFTGIDDPYEPPLNSEIVLQEEGGVCASPSDMAETVISYLEEKGYLNA
ncbi:Adenylyl-sulfate kinase 2, chloroplastic [Sarracenia purpurea var. burkii]